MGCHQHLSVQNARVTKETAGLCENWYNSCGAQLKVSHHDYTRLLVFFLENPNPGFFVVVWTEPHWTQGPTASVCAFLVKVGES